MKYKELTYKIIGCAMEVHKLSESGFAGWQDYLDAKRKKDASNPNANKILICL